MKISIKKRISVFLFIILLLALIQYVLVSITINQSREISLTVREISTIMLIFLLAQTFLVIILISFLPSYLKKMLNAVESIINEISRGSYNQSIDLEEYRKSYDKELVEVVDSIKKMLIIILKFDGMKKEKIQEQRSRIVALLNLTENGFMIVNQKGDIIYTNHLIKEHFPTMTEDSNIIELNFGLEIDNNIKNYVTSIVKTQSKARQKQFYMDSMKRHITVRDELVRDANGNFIGAVIGIFNLEKKGVEKLREETEKQK
ncbi:MAG: hypothetical protein K0B81_06585 [Candidatus Cloacimonetes bacterium]|nr:hypothetical protein [Candidatus Cloacimonadota bacterium]